MASTTKKSGKKAAGKSAAKKSSGRKKAGGAEARLTIVHPDVDTSRGTSLPAGAVKLSGDGLVINVQRLSTSLVRDQRADLVSSMGCISNPGGPGC